MKNLKKGRNIKGQIRGDTMPINPAKLSFLFTLCGAPIIYATFLVVYILLLFMGFKEQALLDTLICSLISYIVLFYAARSALKAKQKIWQIALMEGSDYVTFDKGPYFRFYMGFFWRIFLLNALSNPVAINVIGKGEGSLLADLILSAICVYLAVLWLLKQPYGQVRLAFAVQEQAGVTQQILAPDETVEAVRIDPSERKASKESIFSAAIGIIGGSLGGLMMLAYFGIGLLQIGAVYDFFREVWEWWIIPSLIVSSIVAYMPLLGNLAGFYAAYTIWHWPFWGAFLLFGWPLVVIGLALVGAVFETAFGRRGRH